MIALGEVIEKNDYYILKQVFPTDFCALLADYSRLKSKLRRNIKKNLDPLHNVHREYADPLMEVLLQQLTPLIERVLGLELWPTLSFYYLYTKDNQLLKHTDRSSCQFVASLYIGADEAFQKNTASWPLVLNHHGQIDGVQLEIGDILLFKGHETEHWRTPFTGEWLVSAIFAYVDKNGPFAFQKFDQRHALGQPHVGMFRWTFNCFRQQCIQSFFKK